eukprot:GHVS01010560.1.p1 GENE.GHVS01010560.1~~GHVS01010560.1.p1  ORF type:complete len:879 (-),score=188.77 GHVS01010560.1:127-2763(-)
MSRERCGMVSCWQWLIAHPHIPCAIEKAEAADAEQWDTLKRIAPCDRSVDPFGNAQFRSRRRAEYRSILRGQVAAGQLSVGQAEQVLNELTVSPNDDRKEGQFANSCMGLNEAPRSPRVRVIGSCVRLTPPSTPSSPLTPPHQIDAHLPTSAPVTIITATITAAVVATTTTPVTTATSTSPSTPSEIAVVASNGDQSSDIHREGRSTVRPPECCIRRPFDNEESASLAKPPPSPHRVTSDKLVSSHDSPSSLPFPLSPSFQPTYLRIPSSPPPPVSPLNVVSPNASLDRCSSFSFGITSPKHNQTPSCFSSHYFSPSLPVEALSTTASASSTYRQSRAPIFADTSRNITVQQPSSSRLQHHERPPSPRPTTSSVLPFADLPATAAPFFSPARRQPASLPFSMEVVASPSSRCCWASSNGLVVGGRAGLTPRFCENDQSRRWRREPTDKTAEARREETDDKTNHPSSDHPVEVSGRGTNAPPIAVVVLSPSSIDNDKLPPSHKEAVDAAPNDETNKNCIPLSGVPTSSLLACPTVVSSPVVSPRSSDCSNSTPTAEMLTHSLEESEQLGSSTATNEQEVSFQQPVAEVVYEQTKQQIVDAQYEMKPQRSLSGSRSPDLPAHIQQAVSALLNLPPPTRKDSDWRCCWRTKESAAEEPKNMVDLTDHRRNYEGTSSKSGVAATTKVLPVHHGCSGNNQGVPISFSNSSALLRPSTTKPPFNLTRQATAASMRPLQQSAVPSSSSRLAQFYLPTTPPLSSRTSSTPRRYEAHPNNPTKQQSVHHRHPQRLSFTIPPVDSSVPPPAHVRSFTPTRIPPSRHGTAFSPAVLRPSYQTMYQKLLPSTSRSDGVCGRCGGDVCSCSFWATHRAKSIVTSRQSHAFR